MLRAFDIYAFEGDIEQHHDVARLVLRNIAFITQHIWYKYGQTLLWKRIDQGLRYDNIFKYILTHAYTTWLGGYKTHAHIALNRAEIDTMHIARAIAFSARTESHRLSNGVRQVLRNPLALARDPLARAVQSYHF